MWCFERDRYIWRMEEVTKDFYGLFFWITVMGKRRHYLESCKLTLWLARSLLAFRRFFGGQHVQWNAVSSEKVWLPFHATYLCLTTLQKFFLSVASSLRMHSVTLPSKSIEAMKGWISITPVVLRYSTNEAQMWFCFTLFFPVPVACIYLVF